jgi:hypothetical protein
MMKVCESAGISQMTGTSLYMDTRKDASVSYTNGIHNMLKGNWRCCCQAIITQQGLFANRILGYLKLLRI